MEAFVEAHSGQAVSMLGRDDLLSRRQRLLHRDNATSEAYRQLARDCQAFLAGDPMIKAGAQRYDITEFQIIEHNPCLDTLLD